MPYKVYKIGNEFCVHKVNPNGSRGDKMGCHKTREEANTQIAAIESNSNEKDYYMDSYLSQDECNYTVISTNNDKACANCRFFIHEGFCTICRNNDPNAITGGGLCNRWFERRIPDKEEMVEEMEERSLDKLKDFMLRFFGIKSSSTMQGGFKILDDQKTWVGWWTNNFRDLEDEIISAYAIQEFVQKANEGSVPMPELWWMHIKGTRHGVSDRLFHIEHFGIAKGHFDDPSDNWFVQFMLEWYKDRNRIPMSHGYKYNPARKVNGVYYHIRTYEISSLKENHEANPYTNFDLQEIITNG